MNKVRSYVGTDDPKYWYRQVPRFISAKYCRDDIETMDEEGAERCAYMVEKLWRKQGWRVRCTVIEDPEGYFVVRSDMINGLPRQRI